MVFDLYIIHDNSIINRSENVQNIQNFFNNKQIIDNIFIVDKFNHKDLNNEKLKKLLRTSKPKNPDKIDTLFDKFITPLNINNISNYLKHFSALETIVKNNKPGIILEDDVLISDYTNEKLDLLISNDNIDIVFFGQPFTTQPENDFTEISNFSENMALLPSCESYYINVKTAKKLIDSMLPITYKTNIAFSVNLNKNNIKVHKMYPNLFIDGSKTGKYTSLINTNNILMYNSKYNALYKIIQNNTVDIDSFEKLYSEAEHKESPDMLYLRGLCYLRANHFKQAKEIFDQAYMIYCENNCSLNKTSSFMNNYISFFKIMQK